MNIAEKNLENACFSTVNNFMRFFIYLLQNTLLQHKVFAIE